MNNFDFCNPCRIVFGKDTELQVADQIKKVGGKKVLLHYGGGSVKKNGLYDRVVKALKDGGLEFVELGGVQPNPRLALVEEGIALAKKENVDFVLAMGGGSVIDSSKAIGVGVYLDDIWSYYMDRTKAASIEKTLPVGVILTMPAAGSESSMSTVVTNGTYKRGLANALVIPKFAILNPEITYSMPQKEIANGAADMLAHLMERYFSHTTDVDLTDRILEGAMTSVIRNAYTAVNNPTDYAARAEIMFAGTLAHNGLFGQGRTPDWGSHQIGHELSAEYDLAHGASLAIMFPAWMKYVSREDVHLSKIAQFAQRVFGISYGEGAERQQAEAGARALADFFKSLGLPITMKDAGIPVEPEKFEGFAKRMLEGKGESVGNYKPLGVADTVEILKIASE